VLAIDIGGTKDDYREVKILPQGGQIQVGGCLGCSIWSAGPQRRCLLDRTLTVAIDFGSGDVGVALEVGSSSQSVTKPDHAETIGLEIFHWSEVAQRNLAKSGYVYNAERLNIIK
jgi:hypothetical protein